MDWREEQRPGMVTHASHLSSQDAEVMGFTLRLKSTDSEFQAGWDCKARLSQNNWSW